MSTFDIEDGDDVVLKFLHDTVLEIYEHEDEDMFDPEQEIFKQGEEIDVTAFDIGESNLGVQFGDGSVTFINRSFVELVRFS